MIRQIQNEDFAQIGEIWLRVSLESHSFVSDNPFEYWSNGLIDMIQCTINTDGYLYESDGRIMGFMTLGQKKPNGYYIYELFVDTPFQGLGIGTKLINVAKGFQASYIITHVYIYNSKAINFYFKNGFKIISTHDPIINHSKDPHELIYETKQIKYKMKWKAGNS